MVYQALSNLSLATRGSLDRFNYGPGMMFDTGWGWIGLILHAVFNLAILAGLIILIVHLVRAGKWRKNQVVNPVSQNVINPAQAEAKDDSSNALSILNERYAKGEVSEEDYLKMKKNLTE